MEKKILVPLAEGFEMVEALSIVDVFRRAGGNVHLASVEGSLEVISSHQVTVIADMLIADCMDESYDLIALPGGIPGVNNLQKSELLKKLLEKQNSEDKLYGGICAAPAVVLEHHGLLEGKNATCHPGFVEKLQSADHAGEAIVFHKNCVTGKGAGVSIDFSLELLGILMGEDKKREVAKGMALDL